MLASTRVKKLTWYPRSFCAGMCRLLRAGRFLGMPEVLPQRGAASGGKRGSRGAAKTRAALTAVSDCAREGTAVWPLARAFYRHGGVAAN